MSSIGLRELHLVLRDYESMKEWVKYNLNPNIFLPWWCTRSNLKRGEISIFKIPPKTQNEWGGIFLYGTESATRGCTFSVQLESFVFYIGKISMRIFESDSEQPITEFLELKILFSTNQMEPQTAIKSSGLRILKTGWGNLQYQNWYSTVANRYFL